MIHLRGLNVNEIVKLIHHVWIDFLFIFNIFTFDQFINKKRRSELSIIILASGTQERWKGDGLKQLVLINKIPLIEKTLQQIHNRAVIATVHPELMKYHHFVPKNYKWTVETLLSTHSLWGKRTVILLGDVLYSDDDLETIINYSGDYSVFGSFSQGELFALSFSNVVIPKITFHLERVIFHARYGGRGKLWELYRSLVGVPLHWHRKRDHFVEISKSTDFDTYDEYQQYIDNGVLKKWGEKK